MKREGMHVSLMMIFFLLVISCNAAWSRKILSWFSQKEKNRGAYAA